jgi:TolA-binding protein
MDKRHANIEKNRAKTTRKNGFKVTLVASNDDPALFDTFSDYMKGLMDIEDIKNDPGLPGTRKDVKNMISEYNKSSARNNGNEKFIREIFRARVSKEILADEIINIKQEINNNKLNDISAEWVREWHEKKQKLGIKDPKTEEIRDFISGSIDSSGSEPETIAETDGKKGQGRRLFVRYASLSAAALIAAFLLLRTLLPSSNPDKLFDSYYKPFNAMSPVTRSVNNNEPDSYSSAIESYRAGNYREATAGFAGVIEKDPSAISPQFYLALSQLALKNYAQAINLFAKYLNDPDEYGKEARWYLGLTYLKTGNKQKASECFEYLANSDGFYRERSETILRRLK